MADVNDYMLSESVPEPPPQEHAPIFVERESPSNAQAEQVLLGACLLDSQCYSEIAEQLTESDFYLDSNVRIFRAIGNLVESGMAVDIATLAAELDRNKDLSSVGGVAALAGLTEGLPRRPSITDYIRLIREKSQLRQMIDIFNAAVTRAQDQSELPLEILEYAESELLQIAQDATSGRLKTIYQSVEDAGGLDPYMKACTDPDIKPGLLTGFADYDRMTGGLQKGELTIIAARPSMGKTALGMNIADNVAVGTDLVVAVFSLEMTRSAIERRFMASRARVNIQRVMEGIYLGREERVKLETALGALVESRIFIDDSPTLTPVQLRAKCRRLKSKEKRLDLCLVDYLQLMSAAHKTQSREQEVAAISRSLKACAKELDCPVVAMAQLNRNPEQRQDKRPVLSDLRESGQIEQDADVAVFIHRPEYFDRDNQDLKGIAELIIGKSRNGPTGIVKLAFQETFTKFENLARE